MTRSCLDCARESLVIGGIRSAIGTIWHTAGIYTSPGLDITRSQIGGDQVLGHGAGLGIRLFPRRPS